MKRKEKNEYKAINIPKKILITNNTRIICTYIFTHLCKQALKNHKKILKNFLWLKEEKHLATVLFRRIYKCDNKFKNLQIFK